jgi:hypothetical protein
VTLPASVNLRVFEVIKVVEALVDERLRGKRESGQEQKDGDRPHWFMVTREPALPGLLCPRSLPDPARTAYPTLHPSGSCRVRIVSTGPPAAFTTTW